MRPHPQESDSRAADEGRRVETGPSSTRLLLAIHAELALITADLPAGLAAAPQRARPAPARGNAPAGANVRPGDRAIIATAVFAGLALVISVHADPFASLAAFLLVLGGAGSAFVSLFLLGNRMRGLIADDGSAWAVLASRLSENGTRRVLLEAGRDGRGQYRDDGSRGKAGR
jgi:hypothetical protein